MTDEERRSYDNLILLCTIHHTETNDEKKYPVEALKQMKIDHHIRMSAMYSNGSLNSRQSYLVKVINQISSSDLFENLDTRNGTDSFNIQDKISFNSVKRYKPIIEEYGVYQGKLTQIYTEIEDQGSAKKEVLLRNIKELYLKAKGKLLNGNHTIEMIQTHADDLIEEVEKGLWELIEKKSDNLDETILYEAINPCLSVILVDAFMRCKILEEPPKNDSQ